MAIDLEEGAASVADYAGNGQADRAALNEYDRQRKAPKVWLTIPATGPDDPDPRVYVGVNGVSYWIQKGERVPVPQCVVQALREAEVDYWVVDADETTGRKYQRRVKYLRYPYIVDGPCSPEEYLEWQKAHPTKRD